MSGNHTNRDKALAAWGGDAPAWVLLLADRCDRTSQREASKLLGFDSTVVSRIINAKYPGDIAEVEQLVRASLGAEEVMCPLNGRMALKTCIRNRRRRSPQNWDHDRYARRCPLCPNNTDRPTEEED